MYSRPAGTTAISGATIESAKFNELMADIANDLNVARPVVAGGTGAGTPSAARANLGIAIGTDVQGYDAGLASIAGLTVAADQGIYATGPDTYATFALGPLSRTFLAKTTTSGQRSALEIPAFGVAANNLVQLDGDAKLPAVDGSALTGLETVGAGQSWSDVTSFRFRTTTYRNTTGKPIMVQITHNSNTTGEVQASSNGSSWVKIADARIGGTGLIASFIVPDDHYYRTYGSIETWAELR